MLLFIAMTVAIILLWLNILATLAVSNDKTLNKIQKITQIIIVWFMPFIGAGFILHLIFEYSPHAIPRHWIPWPFKQMFFSVPGKPNSSRDNKEVDYPGERQHVTRRGDDIGESD